MLVDLPANLLDRCGILPEYCSDEIWWDANTEELVLGIYHVLNITEPVGAYKIHMTSGNVKTEYYGSYTLQERNESVVILHSKPESNRAIISLSVMSGLIAYQMLEADRFNFNLVSVANRGFSMKDITATIASEIVLTPNFSGKDIVQAEGIAQTFGRHVDVHFCLPPKYGQKWACNSMDFYDAELVKHDFETVFSKEKECQ